MKNTSVTLLAKLASDVASRFEHALSMFRASKSTQDTLPPLVTYAELSMKLWQSIAYAMMAYHHYKAA
jgi:hypothetical protein